MAETASEAQQSVIGVETSLPTEPHSTETQPNANTGISVSQNEVSDPASNHDTAQESLLSISTILEENATTLRKEEKGKEVLRGTEHTFNKPGQPSKLVLPPSQGPSAIHWKPDETTLAHWTAYRTEQPTPAGQIWWVIDAIDITRFGLGNRDLHPRYVPIGDVVLLIECLLQGAVQGDDDLHNTSVREENYMEIFIYSYTQPSHHLATTSLCHAFRSPTLKVGGRHLPQIDILHLQYHLAYLRYLPEHWVQHNFEALSEDRPGLILERHSAKIRQLSHSDTHEAASAVQTSKQNTNYELSAKRFEECRLSISLHLYGTGGEFRLVLVGDVGAHVKLNPSLPFEERHVRSSLRLDPNSLGHLAGLTHFLVNLVHLMDTWYEGWNETLDKIDDIVGFEMDHTFNDKQLESYIFDTSDSMDLSKQYFTTLQLLRIARQRIENTLSAWKGLRQLPENDLEWDRLHNYTLPGRRVFSLLDKFVLAEGHEAEGHERIFNEWEKQRETVTQIFEMRAKYLTERIDQKTKEVESLRDGLFNATSLREAMKGMALNRAIYLFTAVTIIYTPLSFLAALWALPNLNTTSEGDSTHPSSSNAFLATFIIIPALTYIICGYYAWYLTSTKTWKNFAEFLRRLPENLSIVWGLCEIYASYPFSNRTRQNCAGLDHDPPDNIPGWALSALKWLSRFGKDSSQTGSA